MLIISRSHCVPDSNPNVSIITLKNSYNTPNLGLCAEAFVAALASNSERIYFGHILSMSLGPRNSTLACSRESSVFWERCASWERLHHAPRALSFLEIGYNWRCCKRPAIFHAQCAGTFYVRSLLLFDRSCSISRSI